MHLQARVGFEKSQKKQKLLEARSTAATKRCDALEHRSKQQAAALENARTKRLAAEVEVSETDERCEALAGRLLAAEAAAADARERAANMAHMRDTLYDEACAARDDSIAARSEVCLPPCFTFFPYVHSEFCIIYMTPPAHTTSVRDRWAGALSQEVGMYHSLMHVICSTSRCCVHS